KRKSKRESNVELKEVEITQFYPKEEFKLQLQHGEIPRDKIAPHHTFGLCASRPDNLKYIEEGKALYSAGNALVILDVSTMRRRLIFGLDGRGVGCFAIHPSRKFVAVGEKGAVPNIYIYEYPTFRIAKVLRKGTELGYRALDFTTNGAKLASVGQAPDYMLTVWDWEQEKVILHCKAFGQDVTKVSFSPDDEGRLTTSGSGHIRFWRMASTFTGLKLQGEIGKFGKEELSDIDAFCFLPDGKVVSGAESGVLHLWEGQFIKCVLTRPGEAGCHRGQVMHVSLDRKELLLVTAGADGFVRWWDYATVDAADAEEDRSLFELCPVREAYLGEGIAVRCLERGGDRGDPASDHLLVIDGRGGLLRAPLMWGASSVAAPSQRLMSFHMGAIMGVDTSFLEQLAATAGEDGSVRIWDFLTKRELERASFPRPATCIEWAHGGVDPTGQTVAVGFLDGVVRVLVRDHRAGELRRAQTFKPHDNSAVVELKYSPCGRVLLTAGRDAKLFFIRTHLTAEV
ncbi:unnamed protein product, partial [Discosporangium mesarthrocarpum]